MPRFSANLGFLWKDQSIPDAIRFAKAAGFHAVECHSPFEAPFTVTAEEVSSALKAAEIPMVGINTRRGEAGEVGVAALIGQESRARQHIDEAIDFAAAIKARSVHLLAGVGPETSNDVFMEILRYASSRAAKQGLDILIEPLSHKSAPDYFLTTTGQAANLINQLGLPNIKIMFDCFHVATIEGDVMIQLEKHLPLIGHIQFASIPERLAPDTGTLDYRALFAELDRLGWDQPLGAEYIVKGATEETLGWMKN